MGGTHEGIGSGVGARKKPDLDVRHTLAAMEGGRYGEVVLFFKKQLVEGLDGFLVGGLNLSHFGVLGDELAKAVHVVADCFFGCACHD
jgi:hypothetical protein